MACFLWVHQGVVCVSYAFMLSYSVASNRFQEETEIAGWDPQ